MIVRSERTGLQTTNVCRFPIVLTDLSRNKQFSLVRTTLPRLPFRFARTEQITCNGVTYDLPVSRSLVHLTELLSTLTDGGGGSIMDAYYADNEVEVCAGANDVILAGSLASALGLPTTLTANQCFSAAIDEREEQESEYYRVTVGSMTVAGYVNEGEYTQTVEEFDDQDQLPKTAFRALDSVVSFTVSVQVVKRDGTVVDLRIEDTERACVWLKVE